MASNGPASLQEAHPQAQAAARGSSVGQGSAASIAGEVAVLQNLLFRCLLSESMHQGKHQLASANCNQLHGAREDTLNIFKLCNWESSASIYALFAVALPAVDSCRCIQVKTEMQSKETTQARHAKREESRSRRWVAHCRPLHDDQSSKCKHICKS